VAEEIQQSRQPEEPRWPVALAFVAVIGLYLALPDFLTIGHTWVLVSVLVVTLALTIAAHQAGKHDLNRMLGIGLNAAVTVLLILSIALLIKILPEHKESPIELLHSAAALWITNVLVFASWYWRLDAGGPYQRYMRGQHKEGAFLFPQMLMKHTNWTPHFVDYLFLAFNTSTAFSPTDTYALSRWSKTLMMAQSLISLTVTVLLVARAVNIL
jgi:uncharacterized membrane protein